MVVGQLVEVSMGKTWKYGYIKNIFDDRCEIIKENNSPTMFIFGKMNEKEKEDTITKNNYVKFLEKNGQPVMAKKTWYGKYKFEPA